MFDWLENLYSGYGDAIGDIGEAFGGLVKIPQDLSDITRMGAEETSRRALETGSGIATSAGGFLYGGSMQTILIAGVVGLLVYLAMTSGGK